MKICTRCKESKSLDNFAKGKGASGKHSWCRTCVSANRSAAYSANPQSRQKDQLWSRYRMRPSDLQSMLVNQLGLCLICKELLGDKYAVDHDHMCCPTRVTCGKCVRGLLCGTCNRSLGVVELWYKKHHEAITKYLGL